MLDRLRRGRPGRRQKLLRRCPRLDLRWQRAGLRRLPDLRVRRSRGRRPGASGGPGRPARWTTYFATDDADASAAAVTAAGGSVIVAPMDVGPVGRFAIALDPQGNPFGLWQAGSHTGVNVYNEPGALVWNEAAVDDVAAGKAFYTAVFGFRFDEIEGMGGYATFAADGDSLGGLGGHQPGGPKGG